MNQKIHESYFMYPKPCATMLDTLRNYFVFYKKEVVFAGIFILTASLSFGLGYAASQQFNHASIFIEKCSSNSGG